MNNDDDNKYYTREEVAEILNIAESTVYTYAQKGKIQAEQNPYRIKKNARYTKTSVDQYLNSISIEGITVDKLAKQLNISKARIYQILKQHKELVINKVPFGRSYKYLIPKVTQTEIKKHLRNTNRKGAKKDFYSSKHQVALFQLFHSKTTGQEYRIYKNDAYWGIYLDEKNFIVIDSAKKIFNLEPNYPLSNRKAIKGSFGQFELPKNENGFLFLDYFYQYVGIDNMYIHENDNTIELFIKEMNIPLETFPLPSEVSLEEIKVIEGGIFESDGVLNILKSHKSVTVTLKLSTIQELQLYSQDTGLSISEITEAAILSYLQSQSKIKSKEGL